MSFKESVVSQGTGLAGSHTWIPQITIYVSEETEKKWEGKGKAIQEKHQDEAGQLSQNLAKGDSDCKPLRSADPIPLASWEVLLSRCMSLSVALSLLGNRSVKKRRFGTWTWEGGKIVRPLVW